MDPLHATIEEFADDGFNDAKSFLELPKGKLRPRNANAISGMGNPSPYGHFLGGRTSFFAGATRPRVSENLASRIATVFRQQAFASLGTAFPHSETLRSHAGRSAQSTRPTNMTR